jgi:hypothetical protein
MSTVVAFVIGLVIAVGATARADAPHPGPPLTGGHAKLACTACHDQGTTKPPSKGKQCASCHEDKHHGEFAERGHGECAQCHSVAGFAPALFGASQHATTRFALDGKHAATPCSGCHRGPRPRLGWQLGATDCLDCHSNPHDQQFAKEMVDGGCAHCHNAASWSPRVEHASWQLAGAHARTACAACHGEQKSKDPAAFRGIPRECEGCHDDLHAGQFRQTAPIKPCKACHGADSFKIASFDHKQTRYPLEGAHTALACDACHAKTELRNGQSTVRWRLGYIRCKDCHANPHVEKR